MTARSILFSISVSRAFVLIAPNTGAAARDNFPARDFLSVKHGLKRPLLHSFVPRHKVLTPAQARRSCHRGRERHVAAFNRVFEIVERSNLLCGLRFANAIGSAELAPAACVVLAKAHVGHHRFRLDFLAPSKQVFDAASPRVVEIDTGLVDGDFHVFQ